MKYVRPYEYSCRQAVFPPLEIVFSYSRLKQQFEPVVCYDDYTLISS